MKTFGFILGDWSRNIGNAFFQLGGYLILKELFPKYSIQIIPEQPGYPSYWNWNGGNPNNYFDYANHIDPDYLVLMGPCFRKEIFSIWEDSLEKLISNGTKLIFLGVAAMTYEQKDIDLYRAFLSRFPPYIMVTRDTDTFQYLGDLATYAYDGIDFAFFLSDYFPYQRISNLQEYIVYNFDKIPEPKIYLNAEIENIDHSFLFNGDLWKITFPKFRKKLAEKSRYLMFLEGLIFKGIPNDDIGRYKIVRTDHRPHPMIRKKTYRYPNMMVNDTPFPYFDLYGNAALTLTNRVHASVMALQYGKPAMLFSKSPRIRMLDRLGLEKITEKPVYLDLNILEKEKKEMKKFLMERIGG